MPNDCWICQSPESTSWKSRSIERELVPDDFRITDSRYGVTLGLRKCSACGFIFAESDDLSDLVSLYEQLEDDDYESTGVTRRLQMKWLLQKVVGKNPSSDLDVLDIGAGSGLLLDEAAALGLKARGVEPSKSLAAIAAERHPGRVICGTFPHAELDSYRFDAIFLVDVIEHVGNPLTLLQDCQAALKPGGKFVVVTPDISSMAARILRHRWWHLRLAHVGYFNRATLSDCAKRAGLRSTVWFRAKWFFPIGYLTDRISEYLPVRAIFRGLQRLPVLNRIFGLTMPLNLFDSWVCIFEALEQDCTNSENHGQGAIP